MDNFGYNAAINYADGAGVPNPRVILRDERDELRDVIVTLRNRYGRRRLFRMEDVEAAIREVRTVRRLDPVTPEYLQERKRLRWTLNDE